MHKSQIRFYARRVFDSAQNAYVYECVAIQDGKRVACHRHLLANVAIQQAMTETNQTKKEAE